MPASASNQIAINRRPVVDRRIVLKLGGSVIESPTLSLWLERILALAQHRSVIIVAGGGSLADAVRDQQRRLAYSDRIAHAMAILAMQQNAWLLYGLLLEADLKRRAIAVGTIAAIERAARSPRPIVWLPGLRVARVRALEASWRTTSDSIAAWLAWRLQAPTLLLAKGVRPPPAAESASALADVGFVDKAFPHWAERLARIPSARWGIVASPEQLALLPGN